MSTLADQLQVVFVYFMEYYMLPVLICGLIGNIMNMIIFRTRELKKKGCSLYFVCMSFVHLFVLIFGCLFRIISTLSGFDLTHSSLFFCKFRIYFVVAGIAVSRFYVCVISIDRWMITSLNARIRQQSNLRTARRLIIISSIIWLLFNLHGPIGFRQQSNGCVPSSDGFYATFYLIINIFSTIVPFIILILFTTLTLQRIINRKLMRKRSRAVHPIKLVTRNIPSITQTTNNHHEKISNRNLQLIRLNLIQVVFFILLNSPNTVYTLYSFITGTYEKSPEQIAVDTFFNLMASNFLYTHCAISFFLYTLASVTFRKECWTICRRGQRNIKAFLHW